MENGIIQTFYLSVYRFVYFYRVIMTVLVNAISFKEQITPVGDSCQHIMKIPTYIHAPLCYLFVVIYLYLQLNKQITEIIQTRSSWRPFHVSLTLGDHLLCLWWRTCNDIYHSFTGTETTDVDLRSLSLVINTLCINSFGEMISKS